MTPQLLSGEAPIRRALQSRQWSRRAPGWDHASVPGLERVAARVLDAAGPVDGLDVVDLGSGSGQLTLDLARDAASVTAVDFSSVMLDLLAERAGAAGLTNVGTTLASLQTVDLPEASVDVVVTSYALHHLRHREKEALLRRAAGWLRPGGRIVVGDMMFALTGDPAGRRIVATKLAAIARKGPPGWWRIAKNGWRMLVARRECPESIDAWEAMLSAAGFVGVASERVVAEAAVVRAESPGR